MAESIKITLELDDRVYTGKIQGAIDDTKKLGQQAQTSTATAAAGFNRLAQTADSAISSIKGLIVAYAGLEAIKSVLALGDQLDDLSKATDISIQKILQLQGALTAAGGNGDDAGKMIQQLINTLDGAAQGSADAQYQLMRLGFSFKDMTNLTPEKALQKTIDALAAMTDPIQRNALAFQLLGKAARGIDWDEVRKRTNETTDGYDAAAEAARKAGDLFDRLAESAKNVKIGLMIAIEPLIDLVDLFGKLSSGPGGGMVSALSFAFKALAIGVATAGVFLKSVIDDIKTLGLAIPLLLKRDWDGVGKLFSENAQGMKDDWKNLAEYINQQDLFGQGTATTKPGATTKPLTTGNSAGGSAAAAQNALSGQINAITQLGDAYAKANLKAREKIQTDYDLIGSSDEYKKIVEETARIQNEAADKISSLQDKLKNLTPQQQAFGVGKAINDTIKAIEKDRDASIKAVTDIIVKNEDRIRSITNMKNAYEAMSSAAAAGNEQLFAAQTKLKDAEDARAQALMGPTAKALDQIRIDEEKIADARRKAELATGKYTNTEGDFTNQAAFNQAIDNIDKQMKANIKARSENKKATDAEQNSFTYGWNDAFKSYAENANNAAQQARSTFTTFTKGLEDVIVNFVTTGKLSFKDLATSLIAEFARIQTRKMLAGLFGGDAPAGGGGGGFNIGSFFSSIFGGLFGKAGGGSVMAGHPYMVGEAGKELFIPKSAGTIVPNGTLAGAGGSSVVNNYYSISAVDAKSVAQLFAENRMTMLGTIRQAEKELPFGRGR